MTNETVINNEEQLQFEIHSDGELAYLEYRFYKGDIALMHTQVPDKLSGKGLATKLAEYALAYAREKKMPVMVYCPFVAGFLKKNPQYNDLLDKKYRR